MKHMMKVKLICIPLILMLFVSGFNGAPVKVSADSVGQDKTQIKDVINIYFTLRHGELKSLTPADFSRVVNENDLVTRRWQSKEANILKVKIIITKTFGNIVQDLSFSLDYVSINIVGNTTTVALLENSNVAYASNPSDPVIMGDLEHTITLNKVDSKWVIRQGQYE